MKQTYTKQHYIEQEKYIVGCFQKGKYHGLKEIVIDNFAGGGGASVGIEMATGHSVYAAINHDPEAVRMHMANHPHTKHYCESVWDVDPLEVCNGKPVGLAWFSPDCKHFSKAKGGKPKDKTIRGLAWVALRWAGLVRPRVIMLENVEEFKTWGPLNRNHNPIKAKKGVTFYKFVKQLQNLGYQVDHKELIAADHGTPTLRKRFVLIARCDGLPIVWPEQTHADCNSDDVLQGIKKPYIPAADIINWDNLGNSIFGRTKPLKPKTMTRIANGVMQFVVNNPNRYILPDNKASAFLIQYHSETKKGQVRGQELNKPMMTIDGSPRYALITAFITKFYKTGTGQDILQPLHTITTSPGHFGLVSAFLIKYYGNMTAHDVREPLDTITTKDRFGLISVLIDGETYVIYDIYLKMLESCELYAAQGFPSDYIYDHDILGKEITGTEQKAKCGNAVCPPLAQALVKANLPEMCVGSDYRT